MKKILAIIFLVLISTNLYALTKDEESFLWASETGNIEKVKELLALGVDVNIQDEEGLTALMNASSWGHEEIVKELIKAKADVNVQNLYGSTAFMNASYEGHTEIVRELIKVGADVNKNYEKNINYFNFNIY